MNRFVARCEPASGVFMDRRRTGMSEDSDLVFEAIEGQAPRFGE